VIDHLQVEFLRVFAFVRSNAAVADREIVSMAFPPDITATAPGWGRRIAPFVLGGLALGCAASAASAQFEFRSWSERGIIYEEALPELIDQREMRQIIAESGYRIKGRLRRNGRVYIADVRDRRGRSVRLIIDGIHGNIVQSFRGPDPDLQNSRRSRYSSRDSVDEPRVLVPDVMRKSTKARKPKVRKKTLKTARKPATVITRRPLAAPAAPPIMPDKPVAVSRQPAQPTRVVPVEQAAPNIIPDNVLATRPAKHMSRRLLPPPADPAPVKVDPPEKSAVPGKDVAGEMARSGAVAPPIQPVLPVQTPSQSPGSGSTSARALIAPLDNPGKRRDIEKPVAVAPLQ
jgi:hypothetical protein